MSERIRAGLILLAILVTALTAVATYRQAFSMPIGSHPGNQRPILAQFKTERGEVFAADGTVLATNKSSDQGFQRSYPQGEPFAAITGYFDPIRGRSGLEARWEEWLSGRTHFASVDDWLASVTGRGSRGSDLTLTIDTNLQKRAADLLRGRRGAIVVIDPATGAVQAMATAPTFDPNNVRTDWKEIGSRDGALINRSIQSLYPPGSTFKIVTTAAALEAGIASPSSVYDGPAVFPVFGSTVTNFGERDAGRLAVRTAFAKSTNTIFAQLGLELGSARLVGRARNFGLGAKLPFDLPVKPSAMAAASSMDDVMLAWSAVGQGETLVTPLQMALVAGAVAQRGVIYEPFVVEFVRDYTGVVQYRRRARTWRRAMSAKTAARIKKMMTETVASGTGRAAAVDNIAVAGKTGTAEVGGGRPPHAWFVGFAPAEKPQVAVAVLVENGGSGGRAAAPLARILLEAALQP